MTNFNYIPKGLGAKLLEEDIGRNYAQQENDERYLTEGPGLTPSTSPMLDLFGQALDNINPLAITIAPINEEEK